MDFLVTNDSDFEVLLPPILKNKVNIFTNNLFHTFSSKGSEYFIIGKVTGLRNSKGIVKNTFLKKELEKFVINKDLRPLEGRFVCICVAKNSFSLMTDQFATSDVYIQNERNKIFLSSGLKFLPIKDFDSRKIDSIGLMQAMYIYGGRPAKKHTSIHGVSRLGVREILSFNFKTNNLSIQNYSIPLKKINFVSEVEALNKYSDIFIESVRSRASKKMNVVFLSSGWDSTSILATLVHLFNKKKVKAVIGRMKYSERSGVANKFEIERAKKMAKYFDVELKVVDLDYRKNGQEIIDKVRETYKSQQFANVTGLNHWKLAEYTSKNISGAKTVFAGEMSDGAHNFGFSQYATMFHPNSYEFREYSDKMATYLFGPTFLKVLLDNKQNSDPVWNLFKSQKPKDFFEKISKDRNSIKMQFLKSFFLRSGRMPLAKNNSKLLTNLGKKTFDKISFETYLKKYTRGLKQENLYATYLDLYNSFHWQGATVATLYHACEQHNLECKLPFHDHELINYLSQMPESYGRGLELKPTKYPLKWMLQNRIDYPMHLQEGAHSYTYDVDPSFTHAGELLHHSSLAVFWKKSLKRKRYKDFLDSKYFNLSYVDGLVKRYLANEELKGDEMYDLYNIALQDTVIFS
tara:strand:- start:2115 stop:4010 length:1896 start_codon:yes stop_codon:yes gene_type:complete